MGNRQAARSALEVFLLVTSPCCRTPKWIISRRSPGIVHGACEPLFGSTRSSATKHGPRLMKIKKLHKGWTEVSMVNESDWVELLKPRLTTALDASIDGECRAQVCGAYRLAYACQILGYDANDKAEVRTTGYATDLLIYDSRANGDSIPRVVIECKVGAFTTHDALTYSAKASTHKHVQSIPAVWDSDWQSGDAAARTTGAARRFFRLHDGLDVRRTYVGRMAGSYRNSSRRDSSIPDTAKTSHG